MNGQDFKIFLDNFTKDMYATLNVKGGEYSSDRDRLENFKRGAQMTGADPRQIALIYMAKHFDAIGSFVRDPTMPTSEPIRGRFIDLANYAVLMAALVEEAPYNGKWTQAS